MSDVSVSKLRVEVMVGFFGLEALVDCIIGTRYLGRLPLGFCHNTMNDR